MKSTRMGRIIDDLTSPSGRIVGLDVIRVFAIYFVFVQHGKVLIPDRFQETYSLLLKLPIEGVSVFFLLSGFLIGVMLCKQLARKDFSGKKVRKFWTRRILRIVPNYMVVLLVLIVLGVQSQTFNWKYLFFSQNLIEEQPVFFKVGWSLSVEMWFYFLFPLAVYLVMKFVKSGLKALLSVALLFLAFSFGLRLVNFIFPELLGFESVRKVVIFRLDSMMLGVLASITYIHFSDFWNRRANAFAGVGFFILAVMLVSSFNSEAVASSPILNSEGFSIEEFYFRVTIFYVEALPVLFFLPLCTKLGRFKWKFLNRLVVFISKISYAVYLTHACLVLWFIIPLIKKWTYIANHSLKSLLLYSCYLFLSVLFSVILYLVVEKPFNQWRLNLTGKRQQVDN